MASNWAYKNIPIRDWEVTYEANLVSGEIKLFTRIMAKIETEIIQSKSDQLRNALIDLGWTPPGAPTVPVSELSALLLEWRNVIEVATPKHSNWSFGYDAAMMKCETSLEKLIIGFDCPEGVNLV